ncbi:hypothetical protein Tco_1008249 [Tanacetum coccineum]
MDKAGGEAGLAFGGGRGCRLLMGCLVDGWLGFGFLGVQLAEERGDGLDVVGLLRGVLGACNALCLICACVAESRLRWGAAGLRWVAAVLSEGSVRVDGIEGVGCGACADALWALGGGLGCGKLVGPSACRSPGGMGLGVGAAAERQGHFLGGGGLAVAEVDGSRVSGRPVSVADGGDGDRVERYAQRVKRACGGMWGADAREGAWAALSGMRGIFVGVVRLCREIWNGLDGVRAEREMAWGAARVWWLRASAELVATLGGPGQAAGLVCVRGEVGVISPVALWLWRCAAEGFAAGEMRWLRVSAVCGLESSGGPVAGGLCYVAGCRLAGRVRVLRMLLKLRCAVAVARRGGLSCGAGAGGEDGNALGPGCWSGVGSARAARRRLRIGVGVSSLRRPFKDPVSSRRRVSAASVLLALDPGELAEMDVLRSYATGPMLATSDSAWAKPRGRAGMSRGAWSGARRLVAGWLLRDCAVGVRVCGAWAWGWGAGVWDGWDARGAAAAEMLRGVGLDCGPAMGWSESWAVGASVFLPMGGGMRACPGALLDGVGSVGWCALEKIGVGLRLGLARLRGEGVSRAESGGRVVGAWKNFVTAKSAERAEVCLGSALAGVAPKVAGALLICVVVRRPEGMGVDVSVVSVGRLLGVGRKAAGVAHWRRWLAVHGWWFECEGAFGRVAGENTRLCRRLARGKRACAGYLCALGRGAVRSGCVPFWGFSGLVLRVWLCAWGAWIVFGEFARPPRVVWRGLAGSGLRRRYLRAGGAGGRGDSVCCFLCYDRVQFWGRWKLVGVGGWVGAGGVARAAWGSDGCSWFEVMRRCRVVVWAVLLACRSGDRADVRLRGGLLPAAAWLS